MNATVDSCLFSVSATHSGYSRSRNEDALIANDRYGLWAVADGMGGHERGDDASEAVIKALETVAGTKRPGTPDTVVIPALQQANAEVNALARAQTEGGIIGSTAVALALEGADFHCFWVGDSRAYVMRDGQLQRLTHDHSESPDGVSPGALTRAIGVEPQVDVDWLSGELYEDDVFLLCSDGLTGVVDETTIANTLSQTDPANVGQSLVDEALARGGPDNITVVAVFVRGGNG